MNRLKAFMVSVNKIAEACKAGKAIFLFRPEIPPTAQFRRSYLVESRGCFAIVFEDESFECVPEGCEIPIAMVVPL